MKKILAAVLAAAMTLGMASVAFAATQLPLKPANSVTGLDYIVIDEDTEDHSYYEFKKETEYLYTYHGGAVKASDTLKFAIAVPAGEEVDVDVDSGKVSVSKKKIIKDVSNEFEIETDFDQGPNNNSSVDERSVKVRSASDEDLKKFDIYEITIKSTAGLKDIDLSGWSVEIYCDKLDISAYVKGSVAVSPDQEVESGENYKESKGCVFRFKNILDEEVRIGAGDDVDLYFKGNYGLDSEVLHIDESNIEDLEKFFDDEDIDCYDFPARPKFAKSITIHIDADSDTHIYEFDKVSGDLVDITDECEYDDDGFYFSRKVLGTYVVTEEVYEGGNAYVEEPVEEPADDTAASGSKPNPGTGAY